MARARCRRHTPVCRGGRHRPARRDLIQWLRAAG